MFNCLQVDCRCHTTWLRCKSIRRECRNMNIHGHIDTIFSLSTKDVGHCLRVIFHCLQVDCRCHITWFRSQSIRWDCRYYPYVGLSCLSGIFNCLQVDCMCNTSWLRCKSIRRECRNMIILGHFDTIFSLPTKGVGQCLICKSTNPHLMNICGGWFCGGHYVNVTNLFCWEVFRIGVLFKKIYFESPRFVLWYSELACYSRIYFESPHFFYLSACQLCWQNFWKCFKFWWRLCNELLFYLWQLLKLPGLP